MSGYSDSAHVSTGARVPYNNPVEVCSAQKVPVHIHADVARPLSEIQGLIIHIDVIERFSLSVVGVDTATTTKMPMKKRIKLKSCFALKEK